MKTALIVAKNLLAWGVIFLVLWLAYSDQSRARGSSYHIVAQIQSGPIPEQVLEGGKVWCIMLGPYGQVIGPFPAAFPQCGPDYVTQAGNWLIRSWSFTTGEVAEGSTSVPGAECTAGPASIPLCTIPLEVLP